MIDFTSLNDIYHLSMIIIGFGMFALGAITLARTLRKDKEKRLENQKNKIKRSKKKNGKF